MQPPESTDTRTFWRALINTAAANLTTSFIWFALTFWIYLETRSVLATGIIGGTYMLLLAVFAMLFGTFVDRHRKHRVMVVSGVITLVAFLLACGVYLLAGPKAAADLSRPWFWLFAGIILVGAVVENLRNIALSTTVTLLVPEERRANANGMVGTVQGIAFIVTSVFSGLAIGRLGMGWSLLIATALTALALAHLLTFTIPEERPEPHPDGASAFDIRGAVDALRAAPGLTGWIVFATFNNLIGGVYLALMDPYGLEMFRVEMWGIVFGVTATGFIVGGIVVAAKGLGRNPIRTALILLVLMGVVGTVFALREWWWLYAGGIWIYMALYPGVEAAEQTVIQRIVPFASQGRIFGFSQAVESAATPITAFLIAPLAQFWIIPYMDTSAGQDRWGWLVGDGDARGIALVFFFAGLGMIAIALLAFTTRTYRLLSDQLRSKPVAEVDLR